MFFVFFIFSSALLREGVWQTTFPLLCFYFVSGSPIKGCRPVRRKTALDSVAYGRFPVVCRLWDFDILRQTFFPIKVDTQA